MQFFRFIKKNIYIRRKEAERSDKINDKLFTCRNTAKRASLEANGVTINIIVQKALLNKDSKSEP